MTYQQNKLAQTYKAERLFYLDVAGNMVTTSSNQNGVAGPSTKLNYFLFCSSKARSCKAKGRKLNSLTLQQI